MGLAIGIACFYLIYIYVQYELSYDKSYENHDRIYRVPFEGSFGGREFETDLVNPTMRLKASAFWNYLPFFTLR